MRLAIIIFLFLISACSKDDKNSAKVELNEKNETFATRNYLSIYRITSGRVFEDSKGNAFLRIVEIPSEEHLMVYVEKISVGDEGGNYQLLGRYLIEEIMLGLENPRIFSVDSLSFIDSVTVRGYFNKTKLVVDLNNKKLRP